MAPLEKANLSMEGDAQGQRLWTANSCLATWGWDTPEPQPEKLVAKFWPTES